MHNNDPGIFGFMITSTRPVIVYALVIMTHIIITSSKFCCIIDVLFVASAVFLVNFVALLTSYLLRLDVLFVASAVFLVNFVALLTSYLLRQQPFQ